MSEDEIARRMATLKRWTRWALAPAFVCLLCAGALFRSGNMPGSHILLIIAGVFALPYAIWESLRCWFEFIYFGHSCGLTTVALVLLFVILYPVFRQAYAKSKAADCLSHVRQLALGTRMYAQDYDDVLPSEAAAFRTRISPYVPDRNSFTCPLDPSGVSSYTFNSNLAGVSVDDILLDQTVLIYEGHGGKLPYRHEDRASVAFATGSCRPIGPDKSPALVWTVPVPMKK